MMLQMIQFTVDRKEGRKRSDSPPQISPYPTLHLVKIHTCSKFGRSDRCFLLGPVRTWSPDKINVQFKRTLYSVHCVKILITLS